MSMFQKKKKRKKERKKVDKFFNAFDYSKSINWLYFDTSANNSNNNKHVLDVLHLDLHYLGVFDRLV